MIVERLARILPCALVAGLVACAAPTPPCPPTSAPVLPTTATESGADAKPRVAAPAVALEGGGQNFVDEVRLLHRIVGCSGDAKVPPDIQNVVDEHCKVLLPRIETWRKNWFDVASPFLAKLVPTNAPTKVVYPFAGGDNTTLLTVYPDGTEYTSVSLELSGDVRRVREVQSTTLPVTLGKLRARLDELIGDARFSLSDTLKTMMTGEIPQELSFLMVGLAIHGLEPVSLRYFRLEADGAIHYFTAEELAQVKGSAKRRKNTWGDGDFAEEFSHVEFGFKPIGKDGPIRFQRHLAYNLDNPHMTADPSLFAHLAQKGEVSMMIKASSYLLWRGEFSRVRDYVLKHAAIIVSDSTAPLPSKARAAGFEHDVWGTFSNPPIPATDAGNEEMRKFWWAHPQRALPFRFGYPDFKGRNHLLVTRRR